MDSIAYYTFEDKYSQSEYDGKEAVFYRSFGVVVSISMELVAKKMDGILVCYRTPSAILKKEYRSAQDIFLTKVSEENWHAIRSLIEGASVSSRDIPVFKFKPDNLLLECHSRHQNRLDLN